jgi:arginine/lysine/ornithine decarboxylase
VLSPREAWFAKKKTVRKEQATGKICAEIIMTYPPGIPLVCPGEMLSADVMEILDSLHPDLSFFRVVV